MSRLRGFIKRLAVLAHPERATRDLDDEIGFHLEQEVAKQMRLGHSEADARRRARVAFGGVAQTHESHRDVRIVRVLEEISADVRFALRSLRRSPVLALAAILTLALGIGATSAIYTVVDAVLLRPLPFVEPGQLFVVGETNAERGWVRETAAPANFLDWKEQVGAFANVAGFLELHSTATLTGEGEPKNISYAVVTGGFFTLLGARAERGRVFRDEETWKQPVAVAVVSDRFWHGVLASDPHVIGRTIRLGSASLQIVGVAPPSFRYPYADADVWQTTAWNQADRTQVWFRRAHFVRTIARVRAGVDVKGANAQLQTVVRRLQGQFPETNALMGATLVPLHEFIAGDAMRPLVVLFAAVGLLLLIACANVGNLILVQAGSRQGELSLRLALGAGRWRLFRQTLTESLVLAMLGGVCGLFVGWLGVRALEVLQPAGLLPESTYAIDGRVVLFVFAVTTVSGIVFGMAPSLWNQRRAPADALREGGRSAGDGARGRQWGRLLVIGEVALALMLTVGAGLLVRSYSRLTHVDAGFDGEGVLTATLHVSGGRYDSAAVLESFERELVDRMRAIPGVSAAALTSSLPLTGYGWTSDFSIAGRARDDYATEIAHRELSPSYFDAMRVPVLRGRVFGDADRQGAERVVVINDALARRYFRDQDPIGQRICFDRVPDSTSKWRTIVGVVGSEHQLGVPVDAHDEIIAPIAQDVQQDLVMVLRARGEPLSIAAPLRSMLREMDPDLAIESTRTMNDVRAMSMARDRFLMVLLLLFAALGLVLAVIGVYGVLAQLAKRRTREIGIRIALGARGAQVRWLVVHEGLRLMLAGLVVGSILSLVVTRAMRHILFQVTASDPLTYGIVAVLLLATGLAASWVPAQRASHTDPGLTMRGE